MRHSRLPTLTLFLASAIVATTGSGPAQSAQMVLEGRSGAVRVWDSSARSAQVDVGAERVARSAVAAEGGHFVAGEDLGASDLFFLFQEGSGQPQELPRPPLRAGTERARPVLLTLQDRLDGAVWLEGTAAGGFAVVASAWNGTSWEAIETVAPATGRPQLAPAAVALADGTWLAVWAGFDGQDDEIFWSRRRDGAWSPARRVHSDNRVPDLLPALTAAGDSDGDGDGALAAWSFYDGNDYRVRAARFADGRWRVEEAFAGLGAGDAGWQKGAGRSFLSFRTVVPEAWSVVELGADGRPVHHLTVETSDPRPPVVKASSGFGPPRLTWPYGPARQR